MSVPKYTDWRAGQTPIRVYIRENATGEIRERDDFTLNLGNYPLSDCLFIWQDGNYACDCNREIFFKEAGGEEINRDEIDCVPEGRYSIKIENIETGEEYYNER